MRRSFQPRELEELLIHDPRFTFTLISYLLILIIYVNLSFFRSPAVGIVAFFSYFLINATFLANAFFEREDAFFRLMLGVLALIMLLGFVGWFTMILYNLDITQFTIVLLVVSTISSLLNKRMKNRNAR